MFVSAIAALQEDIELFEKAIVRGGHTLLLSTNLNELLQKLDYQLPHLFLVDMNPGQPAAMEFINTLRKNARTREIPIIAVTSIKDPSIIQAAKALGITYTMMKPVDASELSARITSTIVGHTFIPYISYNHLEKDDKKIILNSQVGISGLGHHGLTVNSKINFPSDMLVDIDDRTIKKIGIEKTLLKSLGSFKEKRFNDNSQTTSFLFELAQSDTKNIDAILAQRPNIKNLPPEPDILSVDDDDDMRYIVKLLLKKMDFTVREAKTGTEALIELQKKVPAVLILDLMMPEVNGIEVLEEMKRQKIYPYTIVLTSRKDLDTVKKAISLGLDEYIIKPIKPSNFVSKIKSVYNSIYAKNDIANFSSRDQFLEGEVIFDSILTKVDENGIDFVTNVGIPAGTELIASSNFFGNTLHKGAFPVTVKSVQTELKNKNVPEELITQEYKYLVTTEFTNIDQREKFTIRSYIGKTLFPNFVR